ncbi:MAG: SDR family NAD(P)-dependent oxidoreductase [Gemmataceae bacterium]
MTNPWKVALITGASSGIGWQLAKELARIGTAVGLLARRRDLLNQLADEISNAGGTVAVAVADVADRQATVSALRGLEKQLGPCDLLIANAGVGAPTHLDPMNVPDIEKMFQVNVLGVVYSIEAVLPGMLARNRGHLVAVSSMAAYKGLPGENGYSASKAAVNNLMEGFRIRLRPLGVQVTTICPGFIATPMTARNRFRMPFLLSAAEAARRIVRALRHRPAVYNFPWQMNLLMQLVRWMPDWVIRWGMADYNADPPSPERPL